MKLMIALEFGSKGAFAMFLFHRLDGGNGTYPFILAPAPKLILEQLLLLLMICAEARVEIVMSVAASRKCFGVLRDIVRYLVFSMFRNCCPSRTKSLALRCIL